MYLNMVIGGLQGCGGKRSWPDFRDCLGIYTETEGKVARAAGLLDLDLKTRPADCTSL